MRTLFAVAAVLGACAPPITVPDAPLVARTERAAREVELCVLTQEAYARPLWQGVAQATGDSWTYAIASIAVKHPAGLLIIDPAFGRSIGDDLHRAGPFAMSLFGTEQTKTPLVKVLEQARLDPADVRYAVVTHAHWDHTGALGDLPNARVLIARSELAWVAPFTRYFDHGVMPHHLKRAKDRLFAFDFKGPPIDGFEASFDVFGDGAVIAVPMPGHTPGSTAFLVRGSGGITWLFSGDTTWTSRGVELPAHKFLRAVDVDLPVLSSSIGRLNALLLHRSDVKVVPAHDGAALSGLPQCGSP
ncbi:MAG: MBL fold metallo-hydrolase [Archangium sp.]|nr:MBL fold metallo-hydrolase [Archangium sp.]